ncbi:MAG: UbiA family prenyltransferase, partial [Chloroflexi bacterium]|nr:UbiA family prenyltransferase [Chloroflexota bacterium]
MRQLLIRVLPQAWAPYVLHLRLPGAPIVIAQMSVGFLLANGFHFTTDTLSRWVLAALSWAVMGSGGTLALNSAFDKDEDDIAFLHDPPKPPRLLALFALVVMAVGLVIAFFISMRFVVAYLICFAMSILYSVTPFRMKSRPGVDMLISATGYGAMTVYSGWAAMDLPLIPPIVNVAVAFFCLLAAWYPPTQFYQMEEDRRRGDRTLTLTIGKRNGLILTTVAMLAGFGFLGAEVVSRYWGLRSIGVALAFLFWAGVVVHWWFHWREADMLYERTGMYRLVWAFAVTQAGV